MRTFLVRILLFFLSVSPTIMAQSRDSLQNSLLQIARKADAQVGIAVIFHGANTITVGNDDRYPLMSVFKFHQALAVIDYLKRNGLSLDSRVYIKKEDLLEDTHSPLRDRYPQGERWLSVGDLLTYTLQQSDNNACDILFRHIGGTEVADAYLRRIGREHFCISATEEQMNADPHTSYDNWTTPLEAASLLEYFLTDTTDTFEQNGRRFVLQNLLECSTGQDRLAAPLEKTEAVLGHKTGTGGRNAQGRLIATNDIGFVLLPNGHHYTIAVFVKDSAMTPEENARIIAEVSEAVYRYACTIE